MQGNIQEEVNRIVASMDRNGVQDDKEPEQGAPPVAEPEPIQDIYVLVVREHEEDAAQPTETEVIETTLATQKPSLLALAILFFTLLLPVASIMLQLYLAFHPFTATITIIPKSQQVTLSGTVQLGRLLQQITLRESQTVPTTGKGHQNPKAATGFLTFYNGLFTEQTLAAGTLLTGSDGVQVVTNQDAVIPAATPNPLAFGQVTVASQATSTGSRGDISAYDINETCCANGILAKNTNAFHGGQDERDFQTVAKSDITNTAAPLQATLNQSVQGALHGQLKTNEALVTPSCTATTTADHRPGDEATTVKVAVSEICSAIAYNQDAIQAKVTDLLDHQAAKKLGSGYSLLGKPHISVTRATPAKQVTLSFTSVSTWIYALTSQEQRIIKKIIAGKDIQEAVQLLYRLPGIAHVSLQFSGFGDDTRIPKEIAHIHLALIYGLQY